ncbi:RING finger domain and kelch repeat-containing protein DDB_G0271372-like [Dreissena polymorpha]|uniref:B box-type domain-containing protein n=1 Tax=Dreissena polymorpha TaxID=45954 RepID=A0A9D4J3L0_DREPO|nr:RING finger domain and kelch repeat-containing protein DDB_G0271372-like [Dreissena polymorpha]KAH3794137.1 hypothetical protein DPMN_147668 [Dreissena polymorpha]
MASNFEASISKGSDLIYDYSCEICEENEINKQADMYCEKCSKCYCSSCVQHHNQLFKKHTVFGREDLTKWPVTKATYDPIELCREHKGRKMEVFCEDHNELLCTVCHLQNHKPCHHVILIADKVKGLRQKGDFQQLSANLDLLQEQFVEKKTDFVGYMQSSEKTFKQILEEINASRKNINNYFDQMEKNTTQELHLMKTSVQRNVKTCNEFIGNTKSVQEEWVKVKDKSDTSSLLMYNQGLKHCFKARAALIEMPTNVDVTFTYMPEPIIERSLSALSMLQNIHRDIQESQTENETNPEETQVSAPSSQPVTESQLSVITQPSQVLESELCLTGKTDMARNSAYENIQISDFGTRLQDKSIPSQITRQNYENMEGKLSKPNQDITVKSNQQYIVKMTDDSFPCSITSICEVASGKLVIADMANKKIKLLDRTYRVVSQLGVNGSPRSICGVDSNLVAVALGNHKCLFIKLTNSSLVQDRTLRLEHQCMSIALQQGYLYITSQSNLYQYTVEGRRLSKMYEDTSGTSTSIYCTVSPDGDRIYVANKIKNTLVTLSSDGTVISTLTDPALDWRPISVPPGLHVTEMGQVLVCGGLSHTVLMVDRDGRHRLAEVVTEKDDVRKPTAVFFSSLTDTLIVGMAESHKILVFKTT